MSRLSKPEFLVFNLIGLAATTLTWAASTTVYSDPNHAVQTIEKIVFTENGLPGENEVEVSNSWGVLYVSGAFISHNSPNEGKMLPGGKGSILIGWGGETLENYGEKSVLLVGRNNKIHRGSSKSAILGGSGWKIIEGYKNNILAGKNNKVYGNHNTTLVGVDNTVRGTHNKAMSVDSKVNGTNNFIAGHYIRNIKGLENTFVWSDNKENRDPSNYYFTPKKSNTFYIRSENGVAIWDITPTATLTVNGLVQIGDEPSITTCKEHQRGTIFFRNNCFYACTKVGVLDNLSGAKRCDIKGRTRSPASTPAADPSHKIHSTQEQYGPIAPGSHILPEDLTLSLP